MRPVPRRLGGGRRPLRRRARKEHLEQMSSCDAHVLDRAGANYLSRPVGQILIRSSSTESSARTFYAVLSRLSSARAHELR